MYVKDLFVYLSDEIVSDVSEVRYGDVIEEMQLESSGEVLDRFPGNAVPIRLFSMLHAVTLPRYRTATSTMCRRLPLSSTS